MTEILEKLKENCKLNTRTVNLPSKFQGISSLKFASSGKKLLLGTGAGALQIWRSDLGELQPTEKEAGGAPISALRTHPKYPHVHYLSSLSGHVHTCDITTGATHEIVCEDNEINSLDFQPQGATFITAGKDQCIRVYDTHTNVLKLRYKGQFSGQSDSNYQGHTARIYSVKFSSANPDVFLSGGWDRSLKVWDIRTNFGPVMNIYGPHLCGDALDIKGHLALTGSWVMENALQLWDIRMAKLVKSLLFRSQRGSGQFLYCAKWCGDRVVVSGGSGTDSAQLLEWEADNVIAEIFMSRPVHAVDLLKTSVVVAGADSYFKVASIKKESKEI